MTDLEQSESVVAVCDLLKGRVEELLAVWGRGSPDVCELLGGILDTLSDASGKAQAKIDAAGPDDETYRPYGIVQVPGVPEWR